MRYITPDQYINWFNKKVESIYLEQIACFLYGMSVPLNLRRLTHL